MFLKAFAFRIQGFWQNLYFHLTKKFLICNCRGKNWKLQGMYLMN